MDKFSPAVRGLKGSIRAAALALMLCTALSGVAHAQSGVGDIPDERLSLLHAAHARPLERVGDDAIRFSKASALGGAAWEIEVHRSNGKGASANINFFYGDRDESWSKLGGMTIGLTPTEYDVLAGNIDALLSRPEPATTTLEPDGSTAVHVCADGPRYLTERRKDGKSTWRSGSCDGPDKTIAKLMFQTVLSRVCVFNYPREKCAAWANDIDR